MASGPLNVGKRRGERTLKCRRRKRYNKYSVSVPKPCVQAVCSTEGDNDFSHLFRPDEEWHGVSGGQDDDNFVGEEDEIGMEKTGSGFTMPDSYLVVNVSALKSKRGIRKLKRRLAEELEQVRDAVKQLTDQRTPSPSYSSTGGADQMRADDVADRYENPMQDYSEVAPLPDQDELFTSLSGRGVHKPPKKSKKSAERENGTDYVVIKKNIPLSGSGIPSSRASQSDYLLQAFKNCKSLLMQLMKHKCGWVFNEPVDADGLKLYDYHTIIKQPMDLGTVKERLTSNWYESPMEFAGDVRLTFRNAMTYNPKDHEVHSMAEQLLEMFEKKWRVIEDKYKCDMNHNFDSDVEVMAIGSDEDLAAPASERTSRPSTPSMRTSGAFESSCSETPPNSVSPGQEMVQEMPEVQINSPSIGMLDGSGSSPGETPCNSASPFQEVIPEMPDIDEAIASTVDAMDSNSGEVPVDCSSLVQEVVPELVEAPRDMNIEEKKKLNASIQELPPIMLGGIVDIIKKKNSALFQNEDEVELDINFLDAETLWELESYVLKCRSYSGTAKRKPTVPYETITELGRTPLEKAASELHRTFEEQSSRTIQRQSDYGSKSSNSGNYLYSSSRGLDHFSCY